jgi:hypothetical protein
MLKHEEHLHGITKYIDRPNNIQNVGNDLIFVDSNYFPDDRFGCCIDDILSIYTVNFDRSIFEVWDHQSEGSIQIAKHLIVAMA